VHGDRIGPLQCGLPGQGQLPDPLLVLPGRPGLALGQRGLPLVRRLLQRGQGGGTADRGGRRPRGRWGRSGDVITGTATITAAAGGRCRLLLRIGVGGHRGFSSVPVAVPVTT